MLSSDSKKQQATSKQTTDSILHLLMKSFNKVAQFQSLPIYRKIERPNLNSEKLKSIGDQLDLEKKARKNFTNRTLHNNYMFNIHSNPFTQEFHNAESPNNGMSKNERMMNFDQFYAKEDPEMQKRKGQPSKVTNLIDQIKKYKDQRVELRGNTSKLLRELMEQTTTQSRDVQLSIPGPTYVVTPKKTNHKIDYFRSHHKATQYDLPFESALDMEQIIRLKDKSYFMKTEQIGNIFKFATDPNRIVNAGKAKLDNYNFCYNSMKDVVQKKKFLVYRDISRLARHLILQIRPREDKSSYMQLSELNPALDMPSLDSILSISSGRMKSHEMQAILVQEFRKTAMLSAMPSAKDQDNSTTTVREKEIEYLQNTSNVVVLKEEEIQNGATQASEFLTYSLEENQAKYMGRLKQDLKIFKKSLEEETKLRTLNIYDKQLLDNIQKKREQLLQQMFYIKIADKDKDRLIRRNKIFKDRYEELKVKNLTEIARLQRVHDRTMAQKNSTRSKSKTPTKSVTKRK